MATENTGWGALRIQAELRLLGHDVAESIVAKYMTKRRRREEPSQGWRSFLRNHISKSASCDFFAVPTVTFRMLYAFVVLTHDRRKIVHLSVTKAPTAEWTIRQLVEAFPLDGNEPEYLHRGRDSISISILRRCVRYYESRVHSALDGNSPVPREVDPPESGRVVAVPVLGGLRPPLSPRGVARSSAHPSIARGDCRGRRGRAPSR